ncbi:MAG: HD-GYP domain-containing protein, partial [Desulfovibrionaceae bacterium]|nr:HD-GYP domain-containing protein [Desulfovibrionaceae bacterium]
PLVDGFIDSVFRNRSAAAAICKLKHFDEYTYSHSINVGILAVVLGERLGLERDVLRLLGIAGVFHDVGKARMPLEVLNKPGKLDEKEFAIMRRHPREGFELMKDQEGLPPQVLRAVLSHHERSDGNGYPDGLKGGQISRFTRVISVVDVYDALTSRRVYKDAMPPGKVLSLMYRWRLSDFSAQVVENFIKALGVYPVGSFVRLSSGEYGVVVGLNQDNPLRPPVKKVLDSDGRPVEPVSVTLSEVPDPGGGLSIRECLNPDDYGVDVSRLVA